MQNGEKGRLPDLPSSNNKFWQGARTFKKEMGEIKPCDHYFEYRGAREITCKKCNIGYYLLGNERVVDGKLVI